MKQYVKQTTLRRHLEYLKINFIIAYKKIFEYKTNVGVGLIAQIFYIGVGIVFLYLFASNFGDIIGWSLNDFIFFFILNDTLWCLGGTFFWNKRLFFGITKGELNDSLFRPITPFLGYYFKNLDIIAMVMVISNLPILFYLFYLIKPNLIQFAIIILLSIFIMLSFVLTDYFLNSFEFHFKKTGNMLALIYSATYDFLTNYPFQYFMQSKFKYFLFLFGTTFTASLIIPILNNTPVWNLKLQIFILSSLIILLTIGIYINWKYGLKKYEAFG